MSKFATRTPTHETKWIWENIVALQPTGIKRILKQLQGDFSCELIRFRTSVHHLDITLDA